MERKPFWQELKEELSSEEIKQMKDKIEQMGLPTPVIVPHALSRINLTKQLQEVEKERDWYRFWCRIHTFSICLFFLNLYLKQ